MNQLSHPGTLLNMAGYYVLSDVHHGCHLMSENDVMAVAVDDEVNGADDEGRPAC
jgi:hypothetical protein